MLWFQILYYSYALIFKFISFLFLSKLYLRLCFKESEISIRIVIIFLRNASPPFIQPNLKH